MAFTILHIMSMTSALASVGPSPAIAEVGRARSGTPDTIEDSNDHGYNEEDEVNDYDGDEECHEKVVVKKPPTITIARPMHQPTRKVDKEEVVDGTAATTTTTRQKPKGVSSLWRGARYFLLSPTPTPNSNPIASVATHDATVEQHKENNQPCTIPDFHIHEKTTTMTTTITRYCDEHGNLRSRCLKCFDMGRECLELCEHRSVSTVCRMCRKRSGRGGVAATTTTRRGRKRKSEMLEGEEAAGIDHTPSENSSPKKKNGRIRPSFFFVEVDDDNNDKDVGVCEHGKVRDEEDASSVCEHRKSRASCRRCTRLPAVKYGASKDVLELPVRRRSRGGGAIAKKEMTVDGFDDAKMGSDPVKRAKGRPRKIVKRLQDTDSRVKKEEEERRRSKVRVDATKRPHARKRPLPAVVAEPSTTDTLPAVVAPVNPPTTTTSKIRSYAPNIPLSGSQSKPMTLRRQRSNAQETVWCAHHRHLSNCAQCNFIDIDATFKKLKQLNSVDVSDPLPADTPIGDVAATAVVYRPVVPRPVVRTESDFNVNWPVPNAIALAPRRFSDKGAVATTCVPMPEHPHRNPSMATMSPPQTMMMHQRMYMPQPGHIMTQPAPTFFHPPPQHGYMNFPPPPPQQMYMHPHMIPPNQYHAAPMQYPQQYTFAPRSPPPHGYYFASGGRGVWRPHVSCAPPPQQQQHVVMSPMERETSDSSASPSSSGFNIHDLVGSEGASGDDPSSRSFHVEALVDRSLDPVFAEDASGFLIDQLL